MNRLNDKIKVTNEANWLVYDVKENNVYNLTFDVINKTENKEKSAIINIDFGVELTDDIKKKLNLSYNDKYGYYRYLPNHSGNVTFNLDILTQSNYLKIRFISINKCNMAIQRINLSYGRYSNVLNSEIKYKNEQLDIIKTKINSTLDAVLGQLLTKKALLKTFDIKPASKCKIAVTVTNKIEESAKATVVSFDFGGKELTDAELKLNKLAISKVYGYFKYMPAGINDINLECTLNIPSDVTKLSIGVAAFQNKGEVRLKDISIAE